MKSQCIEEQEHLTWIVAGAVLGSTLSVLFLTSIVLYTVYFRHGVLSSWYARDRRRTLPRFIVLVRHGESQANVDQRIWSMLPDNLVSLTGKGQEQATAVGQRVAALLHRHKVRRIHLIVSPFERALQTAACMRPALRHLIVRTDIESRIREQEMGNLQGGDFGKFRAEQRRVGRFWYRFSTGESGSDVLDRTKSWWYESVLTVNTRAGFAPVDALVVVTHGLTMRFILMQLFGWSPTTFHSVWNAENTAMYVLQRDLNKPGASPYVLDKDQGDMPRSSIDVVVQLKTNNAKLALRLNDYLSVPPPRTTRIALIGHMLAAQYPDKIASPDDIAAILFMPFSQGGVIKGRSTSGLSMEGSSSFQSLLKGNQPKEQIDNNDNDSVPRESLLRYAEPETSLRFPCIQLPQEGLQNEAGIRLTSSLTANGRHFSFFQRERSTEDSLDFLDSDGDADDDNNSDDGPDNYSQDEGGRKCSDSMKTDAKRLENNADQEESNETQVASSNMTKKEPDTTFRFPRFSLPGFGCMENNPPKQP